MVTDRYIDTWKIRIPKNKLAAYHQLIETGAIFDPKVTYNRTTKVTIIEYSSDRPHEQILQDLKAAAEKLIEVRG